MISKEIKTAYEEEITRQRTAAIALVKEKTEKYDISTGQEIDGVVCFPRQNMETSYRPIGLSISFRDRLRRTRW